MPPQGRPQAAGGPASFSQVSTRFFQAGGCPTRRPARSQARSQPEANQTSFFVQGDRRLACFASPRVVCGRGSASTRPPSQPASFSSTQAGGCPTRKPTTTVPGRAGRSSQFQPGKYEIFATRSQPEASQKPTKPLFLSKELHRKPTRGIVPSTLLRLWEGQCLRKAAPRQRGGPASFSQVSTRFFQAGGCPARKPARSQPEANQTLFLIARSQPNQAREG